MELTKGYRTHHVILDWCLQAYETFDVVSHSFSKCRSVPLRNNQLIHSLWFHFSLLPPAPWLDLHGWICFPHPKTTIRLRPARSSLRDHSLCTFCSYLVLSASPVLNILFASPTASNCLHLLTESIIEHYPLLGTTQIPRSGSHSSNIRSGWLPSKC